MTNPELEKLIEEIESKSSRQNAYFDYSFNADFGYAKGNKDGLLLYSVELLKAAKEIELRSFSEGDTEMYNPNFDWVQSQENNPFDYIQITRKFKSEIDVEKPLKDSWKDKLFGLGCLALIIFTLFLAVVGLVYFIGWF